MTLPLLVNVRSVRRDVFRASWVMLVETVTALFSMPDWVVATRQPFALTADPLFDRTIHVRRGLPSHKSVAVVDTRHRVVQDAWHQGSVAITCTAPVGNRTANWVFPEPLSRKYNRPRFDDGADGSLISTPSTNPALFNSKVCVEYWSV